MVPVVLGTKLAEQETDPACKHPTLIDGSWPLVRQDGVLGSSEPLCQPQQPWAHHGIFLPLSDPVREETTLNCC